MAHWVPVDQMARCRRCGASDVAWQLSRAGKWYLVQARQLRGGLIEADRHAFHECQAKSSTEPRALSLIPPENVAWAREIVTAGYRALAHKHHPDHGGTTENMRRINLAAEKLRDALEAG